MQPWQARLAGNLVLGRSDTVDTKWSVETDWNTGTNGTTTIPGWSWLWQVLKTRAGSMLFYAWLWLIVHDCTLLTSFQQLEQVKRRFFAGQCQHRGTVSAQVWKRSRLWLVHKKMTSNSKIGKSTNIYYEYRGLPNNHKMLRGADANVDK